MHPYLFACSISKFMQKRQKCKKKQKSKKGQKVRVQFQKSYKKTAKMDGFFFYILCAYFCISNLKIHAKKKTKIQKKNFQIRICNIFAKKRSKIIFQKKHAEKRQKCEKKKTQTKVQRVFL